MSVRRAFAWAGLVAGLLASALVAAEPASTSASTPASTPASAAEPAAASSTSTPASPPAAPASDAPLPCPAPVALPAPEDVQRGLRAAVDRGALWRVSQGGRVSWLYGTIHVAKFEWMFPGPQVLAALKGADRVALEMDMTDPALVGRLQRLASPRPNAPSLPAALALRLARDAERACVPSESIAALRPEMAAVTVSIGVARRLGLEAAYGIDPMLAVLAHRWAKDVRSLETPESQMALIVSDDPRKTVQSVAEMLDEVEKGGAERQIERLAGDWRDGRVDDIARYAEWCDCVTTPDQRRQLRHLLDDRNPAMARQLATWHRDGRSVFVAVGILHMVGPKGLPALLAAQGFTVERVAF